MRCTFWFQKTWLRSPLWVSVAERVPGAVGGHPASVLEEWMGRGLSKDPLHTAVSIARAQKGSPSRPQ